MSIEVHFEKRIVNNNVIRESDTKGHRDYIIVTAFSAIFLLGLFAYGWQHYQFIQYGYRLEEAQKKMQRLTEIGRQLRLERASLSSPQRIDSIARKQLGMVVPAPGQLVTFSADAPLKIPAPQLTPEPAQQAEVQPQPAALTSRR